jgi:hypothetical protein
VIQLDGDTETAFLAFVQACRLADENWRAIGKATGKKWSDLYNIRDYLLRARDKCARELEATVLTRE